MKNLKKSHGPGSSSRSTHRRLAQRSVTGLHTSSICRQCNSMQYSTSGENLWHPPISKKLQHSFPCSEQPTYPPQTSYSRSFQALKFLRVFRSKLCMCFSSLSFLLNVPRSQSYGYKNCYHHARAYSDVTRVTSEDEIWHLTRSSCFTQHKRSIWHSFHIFLELLRLSASTYFLHTAHFWTNECKWAPWYV